MRLICTIPGGQTRENAYEFSYFLTAQKISNECEEAISEQGTPIYHIWIQEEDDVERAQEFYQDYQINPSDPRFRSHDEEAIRAQEKKLLEEENKKTSERPPPLRRSRVLSPAPYGKVSTFLLITVALLFVIGLFQKGIHSPPKFSGVAQAPILPPIDKALIYDYPAYFELRDDLLAIYPKKDIEEQKPPSEEAQAIIQKLNQTPYWIGLYDRVVNHLKNRNLPLRYQGPIFEKIGQGQVWRLFTPALLHFDLLHIFFNVLWFILLGNQIEFRIKSFRYLLLIILSALASNTAQYLMSGSFFMGLSGVVVGLAAFIWARQQVAPWEGYLLNRLTLVFLGIFVLGMFFLQLIFFFIQLFGSFELGISIANTAHLTGGIVGYLLGRLHFFSLQPQKKQ